METPRIRMVEMNARRFTFLLFMLICCGIFCALGAWQVQRLHWKENIIAEMEKAYATPPSQEITSQQIKSLKPGEYLRGSYKGIPNPDKAFELSGQIDDGKSSRHLLLPFKMSSGLSILIDMGADFERSGIQMQAVTIQGVLKNAPVPNYFTPANNPGKNIWYSVDVDKLSVPGLEPLILIPEKTPWKDYPAQPPEIRNQHRHYAIFWFTMAGLILTLTALTFRKK